MTGRAWSAATLSPRLAGDLVTLEPLSIGHEEALFAAAQPEAIWEWWPFNLGRDRDAFHDWLTKALAAVQAGREAHFAVLDRAGTPIGTTAYCGLRPENLAVEIGWTWLTPSAWGTGANAEAKLLLLRHAFEELDCRRVEFHTDELNARSRAALIALPAPLDGVLRDWKEMPDGRWRSNAVYSVLAAEWPPVEDALAARVKSKSA